VQAKISQILDPLAPRLARSMEILQQITQIISKKNRNLDYTPSLEDEELQTLDTAERIAELKISILLK
jgi:hypothetical protein